jgi:pimeloyl-ACP methyl ester carboxylesterase
VPYVANGANLIWWDERGRGEAVLLVMGHAFDSRMWWRILPALAEKYRVITYDNRGVGKTKWDGKRYAMTDFADDALCVLDAAGVDRAHVYGASMGGGIAQAIALDHPERCISLILGCTAAMPESMRPAEPIAVGWKHRLLFLLPHRLLRRLTRGDGSGMYGSDADPAVVDEDRKIIASTKTSTKGLLYQGLAIATFFVAERLHEISMPTLVLHGDEDKVVPLAEGEKLAAGIPGAKLVVFRGAGHNYMASRDIAAQEVTLDFLAAHRAESNQVT